MSRERNETLGPDLVGPSFKKSLTGGPTCTHPSIRWMLRDRALPICRRQGLRCYNFMTILPLSLIGFIRIDEVQTDILLDIMIVQFRNEKVSNHGSIPITIDCNVVAFIVFEEGFHQPIKRTKQSVFLDVTVFRHTLVD
ncbi:hypothetical protein TNCV_4696171 [Trichonephila clavipes]|nr:hypothetical protein TNCV_4696171 [Trichonephila clavipes]